MNKGSIRIPRVVNASLYMGLLYPMRESVKQSAHVRILRGDVCCETEAVKKKDFTRYPKAGKLPLTIQPELKLTKTDTLYNVEMSK